MKAVIDRTNNYSFPQIEVLKDGGIFVTYSTNSQIFAQKYLNGVK